MDLLPGVRSSTVATDRLRRVHYLGSGPADGIPVVLVHGNLSAGRFFEHLLPGAPDRYCLTAPDMRGFSGTERAPIDATRGLGDWADDAHTLVRALGIDRPVHLAGWSTGGRRSPPTPSAVRRRRSRLADLVPLVRVKPPRAGPQTKPRPT